MINNPDAHNLLSEARRVLLESLVPELSGERKYEALMIANAMGMAIREMEPEALEHARKANTQVSRLVGNEQDNTGQSSEVALAAAIRARKLDGNSPELQAALYALTRARLAINNPGYLRS